MKKKTNVNELSPLALAYLGDAVFELQIRNHVVEKGNFPVNTLHNMAKDYVNATSQSVMYEYIFDKVNEKEQSILQKGRNAKSHSTAKSASLKDYKHATGLESLFGYLEYTLQHERVREIFAMCIEAIKTNN